MRCFFFSLKSMFYALLLIFALQSAHAEEDIENKVKSEYVYHLTNYIDWQKLPNDAFHVCVLGANAMGAMLNQLANRKVKNLPLKIEVEKLENCQVLFIGKSVGNWHEIVEKLRGEEVLTVSDLENFAQQGGMIGFYSREGKTKLEVNPASLHAANLKISAKLMELARIVKDQ